MKTNKVTVEIPVPAGGIVGSMVPFYSAFAVSELSVGALDLLNVVDQGWVALMAVGVAVPGFLAMKKFKRKPEKVNATEINRVIRTHFHSDATIDSYHHLERRWVRDSNGGAFAIKPGFDDEKSSENQYVPTIKIEHEMSDLGLTEFDKMLSALSTNPDIKAIAAHIAEVEGAPAKELERQKRKELSQEEKLRNDRLDALDRHIKRKNAAA